MKSHISERGNTQRLIEVEVPEEELAPHFETSYRKVQKKIRLEGFRKGKVPISLIKKLYGKTIKADAIEDVVDSVFREVSEKEKLRPIAPAKLEDVDYDPGKGLKFKAVVEVYPEIELQTYKNLSVERENYEVGDEDITAALEDVRERMAVMEPVEGGAEENHFVLADFQQIDVSGVPVIGKKYEDRFFQLVKNKESVELTDQLLGVVPGETRRVILPVDAKNPESREPEEELYEVTVKEVKSKVLPEIDDELAKDTGKFETLHELKEDIRDKLIKQTQKNAERALRQSLIDEVLKKNLFDAPEVMINNYLDAIVKSAKKSSKNGEIDEEAVRKEYRAGAVWNIKWELVKEKIADLENIVVSEDDKKQFVTRFAEERGVDEKEYRKSLKNKRAQRNFENDILAAKVLDLLEEHAKIKDTKITWKDLQKRSQLDIST
ncbi:MAG: trigger factor [bacterium]